VSAFRSWNSEIEALRVYSIAAHSNRVARARTLPTAKASASVLTEAILAIVTKSSCTAGGPRFEYAGK